MIHFHRNIRLLLFVLLPTLTFVLGWHLSLQMTNGNQNEKPKAETQNNVIQKDTAVTSFLDKKRKEKEVDLSIFWEAWHQMETNYLHTEVLNVQNQIYGATKGLVDSLEDPYTVFMTPDEYSDFEQAMSGEFEGIGAEIGVKDGNIVIITPLKGSPAEISGLMAGDVVFKINDESTQGMTIQQAVTKIRGPKGEKVELTVLREGENEPIEISIVRDNIVLKSVEWRMEDDIAIVELSQFGNSVLREFNEFLSEALLLKPKGIILDLRNNGGGLLDACVEIASEFLENKVIVQTEGGRFGNTAEILSNKTGAFLDVPLIVLINKGSASASEIFAGSMQDHGRALLIGEQSFGKGSVQNLIPLSDGSSLKVTMAEWITPLGRSINEEGITPEIEIERTREDFENDRDPVLEEALDLIYRPKRIEALIEEGKEKRLTESLRNEESVEE
jgi:carboxyl-terminal processing protease